MTIYNAREVRFPGINRAVNGRIQEMDVARVAREGNSVPEDAGEVSYLTVADCRHPFGIFSDIDPRELPERLRKKLTGCAKTFLRKCGRRVSWSGCSSAKREEDTGTEEVRGSFPAERLSSGYPTERES